MLRTFDPAPFNLIANHPEVLPWIGWTGEGPADLTAKVRNTQNVCFLTSHLDGGYILEKLDPGLYFAHTLAMPGARGRPMLKLMRDGFFSMFTATDAIEIVSTVTDGNEPAARWADAAGFRPTFRRERVFPLMGESVGFQAYSLSYADWAAKDTAALEFGKLFHERLTLAGAPDHPDDSLHDHWVGATIGCAVAGNLGKGVGLYNRWAKLAGYRPAEIISLVPPMVDIGNAIVQIMNGALDVLEVRGTFHTPT